MHEVAALCGALAVVGVFTNNFLVGRMPPPRPLPFPAALPAAGDTGRWVWRAPPPMELVATVVVTGTTWVAMSPFLTHW